MLLFGEIDKFSKHYAVFIWYGFLFCFEISEQKKNLRQKEQKPYKNSGCGLCGQTWVGAQLCAEGAAMQLKNICVI